MGGKGPAPRSDGIRKRRRLAQVAEASGSVPSPSSAPDSLSIGPEVTSAETVTAEALTGPSAPSPGTGVQEASLDSNSDEDDN